MTRYILRRLLQMIPTLLGVILITFFLFNVVGGSPGSMTLGKNISAKALEEFDELRGFNKPLFFGWWGRTRALERAEMKLQPGSAAPLPLAFVLRPLTTYRLEFEGRATGGPASVAWVAGGAPSDTARVGLEFSNHWKKYELIFQSLENPAATKPALQADGGEVEIREARLRRRMANPFDSQLTFYLRRLAALDFGYSNSMNQPVVNLLKAGLLPSLALTTPIFFLELILAVALALLCAFFRDTWLDRSLVVVSVALMSVNYIVWIVAGQYVLAYRWGWFPVWGFESWAYLLLPVLIGTASGLGSSLRFYRTIMLDEMYKDYVRTAFAKGVGRGGVLFRHVLKNAMIPIVTQVATSIPYLYTGSLLLESFFGIPGLGYLGVNALNSSDVDVVRALVVIGSVLYMAANLLTDLCYAWVDPRVKLEG